MLFSFRKFSFLLLYISCISTAAYSVEKSQLIIDNIQRTNKFFIGRQSHLEELNNLFFKNQNHNLTIIGSAGIGKTQLAKKFSIQYSYKYQIVWWLDPEKNLNEQFKELANEWNRVAAKKSLKINVHTTDDEIIKQTKSRLKTTPLNWLLVFDNVADKQQILNYILEKDLAKGYGHILITSKNSTSWQNMFKLDKFTRKESIELIKKITGEQNDSAANALAETLKDYPLAIVQASSYTKSNPGQTIEEYINLFLNNRNKLLKAAAIKTITHEALDDYKLDIFTSIEMLMNKLKKESKNAFDIISFCAFMGSKYIPDKLLARYAEDVLKIDTLDYRKALSVLAEYSLITEDKIQLLDNVSTTNKDGASTFTMHELLQLAVKNVLTKKEKVQYVESAAFVLANFIPTQLDVFISWIDKHSYIISHMNIISNNSKEYKIYNNSLFTLYQRALEYYLPGKRDYAQAKTLIKEVDFLKEKINKPDPILEARLLIMKSAFFAWQRINYEESLSHALHAFQLVKNRKNCSEERLMSCNRLAQHYNLIGQNNKALKFSNLGLEIVKHSPEVGNQDALLQTLAKIHADKGEFEIALNYANKAIKNLAHLKDNTQISPGDVPIYLTKCDILLKIENYKGALEILQQLHDNIGNIFGDKEHVFRYRIEICYAYANFMIKNNSNAESVLLQTNKNLKKLLGTNYNINITLALGYKFLGFIYETQNQYEKALREYNKAFQIYCNYYGTDQVIIDDFSDLYTKLATINVRVNDPVTTQKYLDLHRKNFGYEHHRTIGITEYMLDNNIPVSY